MGNLPFELAKLATQKNVQKDNVAKLNQAMSNMDWLHTLIIMVNTYPRKVSAHHIFICFPD